MGLFAVVVGLGVLVSVVGREYLAQGSLQQAADIAAAGFSGGGDQPGERAEQLAWANGAAKVSVTQNVAGRVEIEVTKPAPVISGWVLGGTLHASALVTEPAVTLDGTPVGGATSSPGTITGPIPMYAGPLVPVDNAVICPSVAADYRVMQKAAAADGIRLIADSGFRTYAQQAVLYRELGPRLAAPPGYSLHHRATELDLDVGSASGPIYGWLRVHAPSFGFVQRYSWEPWHWGDVQGCVGES